MKFANLYYQNEQTNYRNFSEIKETIKEILSYRSSVEKGDNERIIKWKEAIESGEIFNTNQNEFLNYDAKEWLSQKDNLFRSLKSSSEAVKLDIYKFHQAADYHRHYTIKQLLPKYEIVVN